MNPPNDHQAFYNAKAAYEESKTPATHKKLFNAMLPYLKEAAIGCDYNYFLRTLNEMDRYGYLEIPTAANQIIWSFVALFNRLKSNVDFPVPLFGEFFTLLKKLNYNRPSLEHSLMIKFFLKRPDHYEIFEQFINWWDIKNIRPEDYLPEQFKETSFPPLAESLYAELSKSIIANAENSQPLGAVEKNYLLTLSKELDALYQQYPHYKFFPYYSAKLKLTAGFTKGAMETILPFVRHNINMFWAWDMLADFFTHDLKMQIAIYCRAMFCKADDHLKVGIQTKLFRVLLKSNMYDEAHEELDKIFRIREHRKWKISIELLSNKSEDWYLGSANRHQSGRTYQKFAPDAEMVIFNDQPSKIAVVTAFLPDRGMAFVVTEDLTNAKFKPSKFRMQNPEPGMLLKMVTISEGDNINVVHAMPADIHLHENLVQIIDGRLRIIGSGLFGIVNGVYVTKELIDQENVQEGDPVIVKALRSYDKKKNSWGWKAISLNINI